MNIKLHNDPLSIDLNELQELFVSVGWKKREMEAIRQVLRASTHVTVATNDDRLVGFGRAMSDGVFNATIYDVIVHSDHQGMGVGKMVVEDLLNKLRDVSCVHLISTTGNEGFYRRIGFRKVKTSMARYLNPALAEEYLEQTDIF